MRLLLLTIAMFGALVFFDVLSWEVALAILAGSVLLTLAERAWETLQRIDSNLQTLVERGTR